ncbi:Acetyltransferase, GNAT family [Candidatus Promineifilum breve]|uniref:Acetyltransferase, GNAT family n=1 Tax=Candidatus Promineifilum breve TaxID=1806508 RepID=A0A170PDF5_9CHLR|nr:GNAT family N-acetyltransferase [Candidatus Promineifilum breve]CUS01993.2 Acetyltransferase, GNAT family [Candidatus Promineifilum breve]
MMDKPILFDFPYSFDTERLTLRGPLPDDAIPLREAVLESQEELKPWMPWAMNVLTEEEYRVRVREGQLKFLAREDLWMMLLLRGTDTVVGGSGLHRMDWNVPKFEIGYWVRSRFAGQGYITEAVNGLTAFAFDTLRANRVEIRCDVKNTRSAAVARRAGYTLEGTFHNDARDHFDQLRDTYIFAKIREEGELATD